MGARRGARGAVFGKVTVGDDWKQVEAGGGREGVEGADYLYELGRSQQFSTDVTVGARQDMVDSKFIGGFLGKESDIASGELRGFEFRTFKNLVGDYYVPQRFLDTFATFMAKNFLLEEIGTKKIPLILGIWGAKGCGKSFQVELACRKMGVVPIVTSAGELEDEWAGEPGLLLRERYRKAASVIKNQGKMSCLVINDLDAGCGRLKDTQCTVNNQMVMGTLMNLCDNPERVSVGQEWRENDKVYRVPIIVTANDLSTLYAPLLRDGRMEKFYWDPTREDICAMVETMYRDDGLTHEQVERLVGEFAGQPLDFFGALRAKAYDEQIARWTLETARAAAEKGEKDAYETSNETYNISAVCRRLMALRKEQKTPVGEGVRVPDLNLESVSITLEKLLEGGRDLWGDSASEFYEETYDGDKFVLVDVRSAKSSGREMPKGAVSVPAFSLVGPPLALVAEPLDSFLEAFEAAFPDRTANLLVVGGERAGDEVGEFECASVAMDQLVDAGYVNAVQVHGGYQNWVEFYSPSGKARPPKANFKYVTGAPGTVCVGAELTADFGHGQRTNA
eukprot:PRCOL_00005398-RA